MVRMSPDGKGNFMARWGVEKTAPRVLRDGRPRRTFYEVGASTTRKRMGIVLVCDASRKTVWRSIYPQVETFSLENP